MVVEDVSVIHVQRAAWIKDIGDKRLTLGSGSAVEPGRFTFKALLADDFQTPVPTPEKPAEPARAPSPLKYLLYSTVPRF